MTFKEQKVQQYEKYVKHTEGEIANLNEILAALKTHKGKVVDKRFFEANFSEKWDKEDPNCTRMYTRYSLSEKEYNFQTYWKRIIYFREDGRYASLELMHKETAYIIEEVERELEKQTKWLAKYKVKAQVAREFDEEKCVKAITDLWISFGMPDFWREFCETNSVRYPDAPKE